MSQAVCVDFNGMTLFLLGCVATYCLIWAQPVRLKHFQIILLHTLDFENTIVIQLDRNSGETFVQGRPPNEQPFVTSLPKTEQIASQSSQKPSPTPTTDPTEEAFPCYAIGSEERIKSFAQKKCHFIKQISPDTIDSKIVTNKYPNAVELACTGSHLKAWDAAFSSGDEFALFLEHDAFPMNKYHWPYKLNEIMSYMRQTNIDILLLYYSEYNHTHNTCDMDSLQSHFKPNAHKSWIFGAVAYVVNIEVMVPKFRQLYGLGLVNETKYNLDKAGELKDMFSDHILFRHATVYSFVPALFGHNTSTKSTLGHDKVLFVQGHEDSMRSIEQEWSQYLCHQDGVRRTDCKCPAYDLLFAMTTGENNLADVEMMFTNLTSDAHDSSPKFRAWINVYDSKETRENTSLITYTDHPGLKQDFWKSVPTDVAFEYIWFLDDDLWISADDLETFWKHISYYQPLMVSPIVLEADGENCKRKAPKGVDPMCRHKSTYHRKETQLVEVNWIEIDSFAVPTFVWKNLKENYIIFDIDHSMWGPDCYWCAYLKRYYGWSRVPCVLDPSTHLIHENWGSFTTQSEYKLRWERGTAMKKQYAKRNPKLETQCENHSRVKRNGWSAPFLSSSQTS